MIADLSDFFDRHNMQIGTALSELIVIKKMRDIPYLSEQTVRESFAGQMIECTICLVTFENEDDCATLPCSEKHVFHAECFKQWLL